MSVDPRKAAGLLLFVAAFEVSMLLIIAEALYPGYSVADNVISDLGVSPAPYPWIFNSSVIALGALIIGAAVIARKVFGPVLVVLLVLTGVGAIGVGTFNLDTGIYHSISALIAFLFAGLSAVWTARLVRSPFAYASVAAGAISLLALGLFIARMDFGVGSGGMEKLIVYPIIAWAAAFGGALMASEETLSPAPTP